MSPVEGQIRDPAEVRNAERVLFRRYKEVFGTNPSHAERRSFESRLPFLGAYVPFPEHIVERACEPVIAAGHGLVEFKRLFEQRTGREPEHNDITWYHVECSGREWDQFFDKGEEVRWDATYWRDLDYIEIAQIAVQRSIDEKQEEEQEAAAEKLAAETAEKDEQRRLEQEESRTIARRRSQTYWWLVRCYAIAVPVLSILSFASYGTDKLYAKANVWRISESSLHTLDALGGWPGGLVARHLFHHKIIKESFVSAFRFTVVVNIVLVAVFFSFIAPKLASL